MPAIGFILAVLASSLYGFFLGVGWLVIYVLRGTPGSTGMEILIIPFLTIVATMAGTAAATISLVLPRTSLQWSDSFILLVLAAFAFQALASLVPFLLVQIHSQDMLLHAMLMSGPIDWTKGVLNWSWLYTIPLTLAICSPWLRAKFDG
jgi:hypothetical protein